MTHLELENLASEYLEGLLEPGRRAEVETHLAQCAACRELLQAVRGAVELCHSAEDLEPAPWLISKIMSATVGERKPSLRQQLAAFFRPALHPRFAYAVAMAVFSFSIIVNAAGINLRNVRIEDLNPRNWVRNANRNGHLLLARAEKFYYDLRVVIEIESRLRQLRSQPPQQEKEAPKQESPAGGSSNGKQPGNPELASSHGLFVTAATLTGTVVKRFGANPPTPGANRSRSQ